MNNIPTGHPPPAGRALLISGLRPRAGPAKSSTASTRCLPQLNAPRHSGQLPRAIRRDPPKVRVLRPAHRRKVGFSPATYAITGQTYSRQNESPSLDTSPDSPRAATSRPRSPHPRPRTEIEEPSPDKIGSRDGPTRQTHALRIAWRPGTLRRASPPINRRNPPHKDGSETDDSAIAALTIRQAPAIDAISSSTKRARRPRRYPTS